ncbi:threalose-6-phosphate phosphatase [Rhizophlyctis rosea]|uniref:Threalose-6-phosphate phosphatase n=1 Tax=Rhizophlyctis rosea TaxID=64517 RepID=A0AAD5SBB2_9FUNG|nr:threalose-6-phosphate phosphatase [Rhizophlyctis rosea]
MVTEKRPSLSESVDETFEAHHSPVSTRSLRSGPPQPLTGRIIVATHHLPWTVAPTIPLKSQPTSPNGIAKANGYPPTPTSTGSQDLNGNDQKPDEPHHGQWRFEARRGHSAVYSGIKSLSDNKLVHIGWTGHLVDADGKTSVETACISSEMKQTLKLELWQEKRCIPVLLDDKKASGHYEGYCKDDLWPLFHYIQWDSSTTSANEAKYWQDYVDVNKSFADAIVDAYEPGDLIWIHDYHLLLVPALVRQALPHAPTGFFLHTPFPSSELFRCLPKRKEILEGVLGSNLIGFQTYSYARHFISSCTRVLGLESSPKGVDYGGSLVNVEIFPIGIDVGRVLERRKSPGVLEKMAAIREMYAGKKIIIGRDKLDHIKGVQHKLNAFEKFLTLYPQWQNQVVLIQVTSPPQRESPKLESKVSELVSRINGSFGSLEFAPVHHYHQHLDQDEYFALLSVADLALITSVRDGMNTTSHEFVVCQQDNKAPLILSEFTGTAGSLSAAVLVNPWDYVGVAHAIADSFDMAADERANKHQQLYDHVTSNTAQFWARSFVKELRAVGSAGSGANQSPRLDTSLVVDRYVQAEKRLFMFDYDGTLTAIRKTPGAAVPPPEMLKAMETLCRDPKNVVFVISGRDEACLEDWLGHIPGLGLSAEHGCFLKFPSGKWINLSEDLDFSWKAEVGEIFNYYTERTQGSFVEHKRCAITWHYRLADPDYGLFQAKECQNHLENAILSKLPIEILIGKKNLEVRPISINKGEIVKRLLQQHPDVGFVFCAGDDRTDEDMFKAVHKAAVAKDIDFTTTIGAATKKTHASWHVQSPDDVIAVMMALAAETEKTEGV